MSYPELPLWSVACANVDVLPDSTNPEFEFDYVDIGSVTTGSISAELETMTFGGSPSRARRLARSGDVIVSTVRTYLKAIAPIGDSGRPRVYSTGFAVLRPDPALMLSDFFQYSLLSERFIDQITAHSVGVSYPAINTSDLMRFAVPAPALDDQRRIADYLDRETAEIDAMDAELDRLVGTLRERELHLHQESIDLGGHETPALAHLAGVTLGKMLDQKKTKGEPTPYVRAANIAREGVVSLDDLKTMPMTRDERARLDLRANDTVMIEGGDAGRVAFLPEGLGGLSFQKTVLRIRPRHPHVDPRYLYLALRQAHRSGRIAIEHSVSTIPHFTAEKAERLPVPLPPLDEQRRIVAELDEQTARIDDMIADAQRLSAVLAERRSTLITDVVTGRKEVSA